MGCSKVTTSMTGKVCVVTGASTGIGKAAARALAELGAHVVIVARDATRGEAARAEIDTAARASGHGGRASLELADLSSQAEIRALARRIERAHPVIDVLVNNAGVALRRRELTVDGIERTLAVNYLAYVLLTAELLPALTAAAALRGEARVVNVSSGAHAALRTLDLDNLQGERRYRIGRAYAVSKLADIMFTYTLARRLRGSRVTANSLHPGAVATEIWRDIPVVRTLARFFLLTPQKGAMTTVYLAASPAVSGVSGEYFDKCAPARSSAASRDEALQERLWSETERLLTRPTA